MATLLETLKRQTPDQTQRLGKIMQAKTGSATVDRGPAISQVAERQALADTRAGADQLRTQQILEGERQAQQERGARQEFEGRKAQLAQQEEKLNQELRQKTASILGELERSGREIDLRRDAFQLAQLGQAEALQNKEYVNSLEREGQLRRLDDEQQFKNELQQSIFSDMLDLWESDAEFNQTMAKNEAEFNREVADIDLDMAMKMADSAAKQANLRAQYEGVSGLLSGGAQAFDQYQKGESNKTLARDMLKQGYSSTDIRRQTGLSLEDLGDS